MVKFVFVTATAIHLLQSKRGITGRWPITELGSTDCSASCIMAWCLNLGANWKAMSSGSLGFMSPIIWRLHATMLERINCSLTRTSSDVWWRFSTIQSKWEERERRAAVRLWSLLAQLQSQGWPFGRIFRQRKAMSAWKSGTMNWRSCRCRSAGALQGLTRIA